jgi:hypothetical protein
MKKIGFIAVAALLSAPAFAQDAPQTLSPPVDTPSASPSTSTDSDIDSNDFNDFMLDFGSADFTSAYDALDAATSVNIISLSSMSNASAESFQDGFATRESDVAALRSRLEGNAVVMAALDSAGISLDQVVAINASEDGTVALYINDLS